MCHLLAHARKPLPHANSSEERLQMKHEQQKIRVSPECIYTSRDVYMFSCDMSPHMSWFQFDLKALTEKEPMCTVPVE